MLRTRQALRALPPGALDRTLDFDPGWLKVLGAMPTAVPLAPRVTTEASLRAQLGGSCVVFVGDHRTVGPVAAIADRAPALALAARALGCTLDPALTQPLHPALEGSLAVLLTRTVALALAPSPPPLLRAITDELSNAIRSLGTQNSTFWAWPWRYTVGTLEGTVTVIVPTASLTVVPVDLHRVRDAGVRVSVVAGRTSLPVEHIAAVTPGDVLTLDRLRLKSRRVTAEAVDLALGVTPSATLAVDMTPEGKLVRVGPLVPWRTTTMDDGLTPDEVLSEVSVDVVVEIARGVLTVGEIAKWRMGEVVTLGQRLGDDVTVTVGSRVMARGELVNVDGEVGVRITELVPQ